MPPSEQQPLPASAKHDPISLQAEQALAQLERSDKREHRLRQGVAGLFLASGAVVAWGVGSGEASHLRFNHPMPYYESIQREVNNVDNLLEGVGIAAFIGGFAALSATKFYASLDVRSLALDQWSSRDMSEDRLNPNRRIAKRALEATFAGRIPVMASIGAGLAVFSTAISTEVSQGPERPIEKAMAAFTPGQTLLVNYEGVMPMVDSLVPRKLANNLIAAAAKDNIKAEILDENLGVLTKGKQNLPDLSIGVKMPTGSLLSWSRNDSCNSVPVGVDSSSGMNPGDKIKLNGHDVIVREKIPGISATNRVGVVMDQEAMAACLRGDAEAPVHAVVVDASPATVESMVAKVNTQHDTIAVISKDKYLKNSQNFWESNVKPITSILALFAGVFASAVAGSRMRESLVRNRREWAAKLANGNSQAMIRATEFTRVTKDGVFASMIGGGIAYVATPFVVNSLESGFQASVGLKELAVGAAVAIVGSIGGALKSLINPKKIIRPEESLRS